MRLLHRLALSEFAINLHRLQNVSHLEFLNYPKKQMQIMQFQTALRNKKPLTMQKKGR